MEEGGAWAGRMKIPLCWLARGRRNRQSGKSLCWLMERCKGHWSCSGKGGGGTWIQIDDFPQLDSRHIIVFLLNLVSHTYHGGVLSLVEVPRFWRITCLCITCRYLFLFGEAFIIGNCVVV